MSQSQSVSMEPQRFFTGALNVLHAGFIKASRAQAKRHYARVHGGAVLELAKETLIEVSQEEAYTPIYVKLRGGQLAAVK